MPRSVILNGFKFDLTRLSSDQYDSAYNLLCGESELGEDAGEDEFPTATSLHSHLDNSESFSLCDPSTSKMRAFISVTPSSYCRSQEPLLANGLVICDVTMKSTITADLIRLAVKLTAELGFKGVLADVFSTSSVVGILRSESFTVIARIPNSGHLKGHGWTDSLIMFKDLRYLRQNINFKPVIQLMATSSQNNTLENDRSDTFDFGEAVPTALQYRVQKPSLKYLPCAYTFRDGNTVDIRYACEADIPSLFSMYRLAAEQGQGFSYDEFTNIDVFRFYVIDHGHTIVAVDPHDSQIILSFSLTPSILCRSADPQLADPYLVVGQGYRKKGIGYEAAALMLRITKDLGYSGLVTDVISDNAPALIIMKNIGFAVVGHIPDAVTTDDVQYNDVVICFKDLVDRSGYCAKL